MTERMKLTSAVIFVRDLDRSKEFYGQLLQLNVAMTTGEALLLYAGEGDHVVLRELNVPRPPAAWSGSSTSSGRQEIRKTSIAANVCSKRGVRTSRPGSTTRSGSSKVAIPTARQSW